MNDHEELDPVARLRAADPARDVEPQSGFADAVVARVTGPGASVEPAPFADPAAEPADLAAERARRRPRWRSVAAVAASVAIVGAAGFGIGALTGGPTNLAAGTAAPPISLQSESGPEDSGGTEPAIGTGTAADGKVSGMTYPYGFGRNSFSSSGLGTSAGTAQAYAFNPRASSSPGAVTALAAALGIATPVVRGDGAWTAGPQDGSGPALSVSFDGMLSFYYQNPQINPWLCEDGAEACVPTGQAPGEDAAIGALRSLIVAAGRDPAAFEFTSHVWEGSPTRTAEARPVVDGQRIDQAWSLELAENGVVNANGALAGVVGLGSYAVVSEQDGFERLSDPRFGAVNTILPIALDQVAPEEWVAPTEPPVTPAAGTSISWPVNDIRIVSARLGLASQWQPDGSVLVVPAYEFTDTDGGTWSVIAVADSLLDFESD